MRTTFEVNIDEKFQVQQVELSLYAQQASILNVQSLSAIHVAHYSVPVVFYLLDIWKKVRTWKLSYGVRVCVCLGRLGQFHPKHSFVVETWRDVTLRRFQKQTKTGWSPFYTKFAMFVNAAAWSSSIHRLGSDTENEGDTVQIGL